MQTGTLSTAQVERALREVYSRPEFAGPVRKPDPWAWLREWAGRLLARLAEWMDGLRVLEHAAPIVMWIVVGIVALAAIFLLAHLARTGSGALTRGRREGAAASAAGRLRGPADWEADARRAASEGRLRDAALALYHALVLRLDARGALRFDPAKTPGDYRREVREHPEVARPFTAFLRGFEPVAFGGRALDPDGYERLRAAAGEAGAHG